MRPKRLRFWAEGHHQDLAPTHWVRDIAVDTSGTDYLARYSFIACTHEELRGLYCTMDNDLVFKVDDQAEADDPGESIIHITQIKGIKVR
jgi:hypothetical protein